MRADDGQAGDEQDGSVEVDDRSDLLREWVVDSEAVPSDLDALTEPDEAAWIEERRPYLIS